MTNESKNVLLASKQWFLDKYWQPIDHPLKHALQTLILTSDYACLHHDILLDLLKEPQINPLTRKDYFGAIRRISLASPQDVFMKELRLFRHKELLRLLMLQYAETLSIEDVMMAWSDCADALICCGLDFCKEQLHLRHGVPRKSNGEISKLYVLAMGKLGGRELNFSSDVDLIFTYDEAGDTDGHEVITNQMYYSKVVRNFVAVMQNVTADGFAFRVDLRLRPNGDSGPLLLSLTGMETYYQEQGRDWERYAMVKARVIQEQVLNEPTWYTQLITPFVYRRYIDFGVIESLRSMKGMIEREVLLNPCLNDLKRGQGGIREVEFVVQNMQLIRGGRLATLRTQSTLIALDVCKEEKLLHHVTGLRKAYLFLRRLENAVQVLNDQQTHALPDDELKQAQIAVAMGYQTWEQLTIDVHQCQRIVSYSFKKTLAKAYDYEDSNRLLANQFMGVWQGHIEQEMSINLLASLGFKEAERAYQMLVTFRQAPRCKRLTQASRMRLDRFMVILLTELSRLEHIDDILLQVMHVLEHLVGRSAYLALLAENPKAMHELLYCIQHSPYLTNLLVNQPFLLEYLLEDRIWRPMSISQISKSLQVELSYHAEPEELLRQYKLKSCFLAARAELYGHHSALEVGRFLADLAQAILTQVFHLACNQLAIRYPEIESLKSRVVILAYGTFGSREMNFTSDLDLVFIHSAKVCEEPLVTRLTQKILNVLTVRSQSGILYSVDTRLRPSGSSGLLVSTMRAFKEYQQQHAWTWEHQALLKARVVVGSATLKRQFMELKKHMLINSREELQLQEDILTMRAKINEHLEHEPIKKEEGGLLDLEFLVQYLVLKHGDPAMARFTDTGSLIQQLGKVGAITAKQASILEHALQDYLKLSHQSVILGHVKQEPSVNAAVSKIYDRILRTDIMKN